MMENELAFMLFVVTVRGDDVPAGMGGCQEKLVRCFIHFGRCRSIVHMQRNFEFSIDVSGRVGKREA
jgi:hypothetical protein